MPPRLPERLLLAKWEQRLQAEGKPAELTPIARHYLLGLRAVNEFTRVRGGRLEELVVRAHARMQDAMAYDEVVRNYLHRARWRRYPGRHRIIWEMHVEQVPVREIGHRMDLSRMRVQRTIKRHLALAKEMAGV